MHLLPSPPPEPDHVEHEHEPQLEDGFSVLRELLAAGEAATAEPEPDNDGWISPEDHAEHEAELARLAAEVESLKASLAEEFQRAEDLRTELDEALDQAEGWEAQAAALRADRDELEAEAESLRIEAAELREATELYDGPERRSDGPDQRDDFEQLSQGERRRGLAPRVGGRRRPLRVRGEEAEEESSAHEFADDYDAEPDPEPEPEDEYVEEHAEPELERGAPGWSGRLRDVGELAAWGPDDLERLRAP